MDPHLVLILQEGEGYLVEFKEKIANLDREIVAFANGNGGSIFLGVKDVGEICGITVTNEVKSQVVDIARNCDPSIPIDIRVYKQEAVLEIIVSEGSDKPYRCRDGFFIRIGPNSQKLKRDEIVQFINDVGKIHFDEAINKKFNYPKDFSKKIFDDYLERCKINIPVSVKDVLLSLGIAIEKSKQLQLTNAAVLFFAKEPQHFFPESYLTVVCYQSLDRFLILEKRDIDGDPIHQIEEALIFIQKNIHYESSFHDIEVGISAARRDIYDYPLIALREAIVNAVMHRDYYYDGSHVYIHLFPDRIEIENPGGLYKGLTVDKLGHRSIRRNRMIADLLHRANYVERVGSGFDRMQRSLQENHNPPLEVSATNFFSIRFYKRVPKKQLLGLTQRQQAIYQILKEKSPLNKTQLANFLQVSGDTILRDLNYLIRGKWVVRSGTGKSSVYEIQDK